MELPACPVETTLMLIGDKWKVLILRDLMDGTKRFGELKKSIGHVTQKVLTAQLRQMEASGLLTRSQGTDAVTNLPGSRNKPTHATDTHPRGGSLGRDPPP